MYFVYILQSCKSGRLYVGQTDDVTRRLYQQNSRHGGKYTHANGPWKLLYSESQPDRSSAMKRERYLKSTKGSYEKKQLAGLPVNDVRNDGDLTPIKK
jgi:putative endonuclease